MGLDMYLRKKIYIGNKYREKDKMIRVYVPENQEGVLFPTEKINHEKVAFITEEIGYWRKANSIHRWFVDNVQNGNDDCGEYCVPIEKLKELLDIVNKVLEKPSSGKTLLPCINGFFFGSTDYDKWYVEDLKYTKKILEEAIEDGKGDIYYTSSW